MSKFKGLIDAANTRENTAAQPAPVVMPTKRPSRGRPRGKRSDPNFEQITAYIRKQTHQASKLPCCRRAEARSSASSSRIYLLSGSRRVVDNQNTLDCTRR